MIWMKFCVQDQFLLVWKVFQNETIEDPLESWDCCDFDQEKPFTMHWPCIWKQYFITANSSAMLFLYQGIFCFVTIIVLFLIGTFQSLLFLGDENTTYSTWGYFALCFYGVIGVTQFFLRLRSIHPAGPVIVGFVSTSEMIVSYVVEIIVF